MGENRFWVRNEVANTRSLIIWTVVNEAWDWRHKTLFESESCVYWPSCVYWTTL